jgi:hypothetical protein
LGPKPIQNCKFQPFSQHKSVFVVFVVLIFAMSEFFITFGNILRRTRKTVNVPAKKHGAPSAHTIAHTAEAHHAEGFVDPTRAGPLLLFSSHM